MTLRLRVIWSVFLASLCLAGAAPAQEAPIRVGILVYPGVYNTEFIAPLDVFNHAAKHSRRRLEVFTVAPTFGSVTTAEGLRILPQYSFPTAPAIDWLIVPSGANYRSDVDDAGLVNWIRQAGHGAQIVHSNCWGAFLLGAAGLLDAKRATTYPKSLEEFAQRFPNVRVEKNLVLVDDDGVVTSAGGVVSYDAALYLVEKYLGGEVAEQVATGLVIDWQARRANYQTAAAGSQP